MHTYQHAGMRADTQRRLRLPSRFHRSAKSARSYLRLPLLLLALLATGCSLDSPAEAQAFGYDTVVAKAQALAAAPYKPAPQVPKAYAQLDYSHWSGIRFKRSKALWQDSRFHVQFSPAGYLFDQAVTINIVEQGKSHPLNFDPAMFDVDKKLLPQGLSPQLGFAGFRLTYPLNRADKQDEFLSFLGASYFRAVPQKGWFGLSARGVAIDTTADAKEQFPRFSSFWLVKPKTDADQLTIYALLNGRSLTGAYRFTIKPGTATVMDVSATLFLRHPVEQLGLAPLTSMFFYGVGNHKPADQALPAIHDSDGLLMHRGDNQWTWRPLDNPKKVRTLHFPTQQLHGFGLLQRDRRAADYQDPESHYAQRPDLWIEPQGDWGAGRVSLIEIPTTNSYMDNIVAFWSPKQLPETGQPLHLDYRMSWRIAPVPSSVGRVEATLIGANAETGAAKYVIDYAGNSLDSSGKSTPPKGWVMTTPTTQVTENRVEPNPYTGGWRQVIQVMPLAKQAVKIRAGLGDKDSPLSEIWTYRLGKNAH